MDVVAIPTSKINSIICRILHYKLTNINFITSKNVIFQNVYLISSLLF